MLFCCVCKGVKIHILLLLITASFIVNGQNSTLMPDMYDQFFQNYYLINPANTDTSEIIVNMGHKSQTGIFHGVRQTYFDANFRIKSSNLNNRHYVGIQLFNNSEGDFFSRSRAYGRYSFDIKLSNAYYLSAGASFGAVNYVFKATQSSAGGSALTYDGALGLWLVSNRFKLGASMQQVFQRSLAPLNQEFVLRRVYNINGSYKVRINHYVELTTHFWYKYQQYSRTDVQIAAIVTLQQLVDFGMNYRYKKGLVLIAGLKDIPIGTSKISLAMSYSTGVLNYIAKGDNGIEIFIKYSK
jgi:type IX secretion system PorP/SprF family membrane protein